MQPQRAWRIAYYILFIAFLVTAALNMLHIRAGFLTNRAADVAVPAWLYLIARGLHDPHGRVRLIQRLIGRTPELAALSLFVASTLTEVSQYFWPHGIFRGTFDPLDILAYALGLAVCYAAERLSTRTPEPVRVANSKTVARVRIDT